MGGRHRRHDPTDDEIAAFSRSHRKCRFGFIQAKHARVYPLGNLDDRPSRLDAVLSRTASLLRRFSEITR
jgi:hypothetical protein